MQGHIEDRLQIEGSSLTSEFSAICLQKTVSRWHASLSVQILQDKEKGTQQTSAKAEARTLELEEAIHKLQAACHRFVMSCICHSANP